MQDLRVIGVEDGSLLVADDDGTKYRINVDEVLHANLRPRMAEVTGSQKLAPKDIQAHIRSGMSAEDVAAITGVPLEHIQRYEGPVLAERDYVVQTARSVPVHAALDTDPLGEGATFGSIIAERLEDLGADGERWASWKEAGEGWVVKLAFTANKIDHDARWRFDPKKLALDPMNGEAVTLSQQGESRGVLIPRLRAVHPDERPSDNNRFDSGAFDLDPAPSATQEFTAQDFDFSDAEGPDADDSHDSNGRSTQPLPNLPVEMNQTADLLEALRRRRGEREAASFEDDDHGVSSSHPSAGSSTPSAHSNGGIRIVDVPLDLPPIEERESKRRTGPQPSMPAGRNGRKGRPSMPSWDEIVFGARPDDDLA
jgi:hypothetical protein